MEMSQITKCDMSACVYNQENRCTTMGITVGLHGECNTFNHGSAKGGIDDVNGGVGACLAADCMFNEKLECKVPKISVMVHDRHPDCATFKQKK